jgi:hypothetical protein
MTTDILDQFIMALASHLAHTTDLPQDQAAQLVGDMVAQVRAEYRDAGATYGDDAMGFLCWLREQRSAMPADERTAEA